MAAEATGPPDPPGPGPDANPELAQDDPETDRQFGTPVGRDKVRSTQEREQVDTMGLQVLGQALADRIGLGREDQIGQLVLQATAGHGQTVPVDLLRRVTITQVQASPE